MEIGLITGNLAQLHSNQQTMRVKICFCVISWCFQAVKTWVSHHFLQVSWSFLGCSSLIWPQQTTLNAAHLIMKITVGILAAINSGLVIMVLHHIRQIWKTLFKLLSFKKKKKRKKMHSYICFIFFPGIKKSNTVRQRHVFSVSAPSWIFLRVLSGSWHPVLECGSKRTKMFYQPGMSRMICLCKAPTDKFYCKGAI